MKKSMIIWGTALILIIIAAYTMFTYSPQSNTPNTGKKSSDQKKQPASESKPQPSVNAAPDFTLNDLDGNKVTLSQLQGKKVFLNFWATWCPPCRAEMPDIEKLKKETTIEDLVILAVNIGEDKETVSKFIQKNSYSFKILLDQKGTVAEQYKVNSIPASFFMNTDGSISSRHVGTMNLTQMKDAIASLK
ncbi:MAG: TlpA family protein disulfide reductase [Clostridia bacterium]|nr:TlpA family protein disulfide reductase [Clostridia bacterium]